MAASDSDTSDKAQESLSSLAEQETSYLYVRSLGAGAFGEANLYRKTEVQDMHLKQLAEIRPIYPIM
ncbi:hypothetical protein CHS0354_004083 [Potamilus streckersoni]|uniref:Uncharacterized protein n=1 Tax=Potamilus streckersoni TaxID=2493646 RepID=A0AAE0T846_9BIVA|nr:hypothetical protein CHS0354_004083 [Potamilus streckersoni]